MPRAWTPTRYEEEPNATPDIAPGRRTLTASLPASTGRPEPASGTRVLPERFDRGADGHDHEVMGLSGIGQTASRPAPEDAPLDLDLDRCRVPAIAAARARLTRPGYRYLEPFALPVMRRVAASDGRDAEALARLAQLFEVSKTDGGGELADPKQASNAYHAELGDRAITELTAALPTGSAEVVRADRERAARALAAAYIGLLEDDVRMRIELGEPAVSGAATSIPIAIGIEPNNWWKKLLLVGGLGLGVGVLVWRVVRGSGAAEQRDEARAPTLDAPTLDAPAPDGAQGVAPVGTPIRGALNYNNDCFLHAACQVLAHSYLDALQDTDEQIQAFLIAFRGAHDPVDPVAVVGLRTALLDGSAVALAAAEERMDVRHLERLAVLRRFLARINEGGADPIGGLETQRLRQLLRDAGIVQTASGQEDAAPLFSQILDVFGRGNARTIRGKERVALTDWQTPDVAGDADLPARRDDWVPYLDPHAEAPDAPEAPERERDTTQDALYVPVNTEHAGLIAWLTAMYGDGIVETFDDTDHRETHEWAGLGPARTPVAVTARTVSARMITLPPLLTVFLRRSLPNGQKDRRAFAMPEVMTLVEQPDDGPRVVKTYTLQTFLHHQGANANSGHYWAHRRLDTGWHAANNARVTVDAQSDAPVEGQIESDINHGYLYTYTCTAQHDADADEASAPTGTAFDRTQLPLVAPPPPPLVMPDEVFDDLGGASLGELPRKSRQVRGTGKVRAKSAPGLVDTVEKLVPASQRGALYAFIDEEIAVHLPRVLHAYEIDLPERVGRGAVTLPLIDVVPAMRLLDQVIAWWMFFNPTLMQRPVDDIMVHLAQHLEGVIANLERDRGRIDIGSAEDDEGATQLGAPATAEPTREHDAPTTPALAKDAASEPTIAQDASPPVESARPAVTASFSLFDEMPGGWDDSEEDAAAAEDLRTPAERAIPDWLQVAHYDALRARMIAHHDAPEVTWLREGPLAATGPAARKLALILLGLEQGVDPDKLRDEVAGLAVGAQLVDAAAALELLPGLGAEALASLKPAPRTKPTESAEPLPPPPLGADALLTQSQREGWLTRRETDQAMDAVGSRVLVRSLARNREKQKLSKIRALIEQLAHVPTTAEQAPPLTSHSLILDTNLVDVLVLDRAVLSPAELTFRAEIVALIEEHGITDLRLANMNVGETHAYGDLIGTMVTVDTAPPKQLPWFGVPLEGDARKRTGDYNKLLMELEAAAVGEAKGHEDRSMVADAFFADMAEEPGTDDASPTKAVPQLATADKGIYNALMRLTDGTDGAKLDPTAYKELGSHEAMVTELAKKTGARYFAPTVGGRQLVVHPLVKPRDELDDDVDHGAKAAAFADPRDAPVGKFTVRDLMGLISGAGYGVMIVGGAVRDLQVGKAPKDVDIKTNMPLAAIEELVASTAEWKDLPRHRFPEMHLLKIGVPPDMIDVSCGPDGGAKGPFDAHADAPTRDFRMNALYMDADGAIVDPLGGRADLPGADKPEGRIRFAADPGPKDPDAPRADAAERVAKVVAFLKQEPWVLGRTLKFLTRGYELDVEILDGVREHAVEILRTVDEHERPAKTRSLLIFKTDLESPEELVELMRRYHFPGQAIRMVLPDSVAGQFNATEVAHDRDVMPRNRGLPAEARGLGAAPALKVDTASGRLYQYRVEAVAPPLDASQKDEAIIIDVDCTNHDVSGHPAPHYHVFRWFGEKGGWDKKHSGLSNTGEPGMPALDGRRYLGPQPWRWLKGTESGADILNEVVAIGERAGVPVTIDGEVADLGGQVNVHRLLLAQILSQGHLHELFLVVRQLLAGQDLDPDDPLVQEMVGSKQGQFRLRFTPQLAHVAPFLASCGIAEDHPLFAKLTRRQQLRLFDLVNADVPAERRKPAATWALQAAATVDEFVQRFEFMLSSDAAPGFGLDEAWEAALKAVEAAGIIGGTPVGEGAIEDAIGAVSRLGFDSASTAAYHLQKHLDELDDPTAARADLVEAAQTYAAQALAGVVGADKGRIEVSGDETGDTVLVCWQGNRKTVVRVTADRTAFLVTSFTKSGGHRSKAAAPRQIKQAVVPQPVVAVDPVQERATQIAKAVKVGRTFTHQAPGASQQLKCRVLSSAQARARGVVDPLVLDDASPAIAHRDGALYVVGLAEETRAKGAASFDRIPEAEHEIVMAAAEDF